MAPKRPPSPSSSGSESGSSSDEEDEQQQQQQQAQSTPPSKKPLSKKPSAAPSPSPATMPAVKPSSSSRPSNSDSGTEDDDDDEEEEDEEEEGGSDDSGSPPMPPAAAAAAAKPEKPKPKEAAAPATKPPPSESESESDESDSDAKPPPPPRRPSRGPDPIIKPISSKPMDETPKSKKAAAAAAAASSSEKPKAAPASESDTKKRKRKELSEVAEEEEAAANGASGKRPLQRVWTEEDEIAILKGIIEFQAYHGGADPASAIDAFHEFIYKSLHLEFSKGQISDKMRRLKKKYETNSRRGKKGADPSFANKPHEQAAFELSKKIWAGKRSPGSAVSRCSGDGEDGERRAGALYPKLRDAVALLESKNGEILLGGSLWKALELLKPARAKALEETWNKHFMAGMKYFLERTALKKDLLKSLVESLDNA